MDYSPAEKKAVLNYPKAILKNLRSPRTSALRISQKNNTKNVINNLMTLTKNKLKFSTFLKVIVVYLTVFAINGCKGPQGDPGPIGTMGSTGTTGATGAAGNTIDYGTTAPSASTGNNGDFYINTATDFIYGPKANGAWPAGVALVGPRGAMGAAGANGNTVDYGTTAPLATVGNNGDFYICTTTNFIYGPKANGTWPAGASLVGPQGATGLTPDSSSVGQIAFWKLNGNSDDASGNGNTGNGINVLPTYDRFGRSSGAFKFEGASVQPSYITVPDVPALRLLNTDYSINFWVKMNSFNTNNIICSIIGKLSGYVVWIGGNLNSTPNFPTGDIWAQNGQGGVTPGYVTAISPLDLNNWHMVTVVYTLSNTTLSVFVDGQFDNAVSNAGIVSSSTGQPLTIGAFITGETPNGYYGSHSTFLDGELDDIRIYNQAISYTRIQKLLTDTSNE